MNKGFHEYPGFFSRMSELERKLKESEDERLALEDKFNKLLNARKSEEEMHLYLLRSNYSQLLRQDKTRCDRNDMILQSLANVENRASMLTAKTDRLRLLRQHYESYVNRHYPGLKKAVGRYRSVESLNSDINENISQRSVSSSPRRMYSHSPSPFVRSPAITRKNSLVVSNSEIINHISYKVPDKINLTSHFSRRKIFEDSSILEKDFKSPSERTSSPLKSRNDGQENSFKNSIPTIIKNTTTDQLKVEQNHDLKGLPGTLLLNVPSYSDYTGQSVLESNNVFTKRKSENSLQRMSPPFRNSIPEGLSPISSSTSTLTFKPSSSRPLTKSSSFSYSSNASNNISHEQRYPSIVRRPSLFYQSAISHKPLRVQTAIKSSFFPESMKTSYSENVVYRKRPSLSEKYSYNDMAKSPLSEIHKTSIGYRKVSPVTLGSKSHLTVVDDIFKKYLINYDKTYLCDPISQSKYGKYLYPLNNYDCTNIKSNRGDNFSKHLESKLDVRSPDLYDVLSLRENISTSAGLNKTYGSQDSIFTNDTQSHIYERDMSCFDDKKDWKEWQYYKNRYEYPPTLEAKNLHTRSAFLDDSYNRRKHGSSICMEAAESTPYRFSLNPPFEYSYPQNWSCEVHDYNPYGFHLENTVENQYDGLSNERKLSEKYNSTSKDSLKNPPQTPKKVSFSNEFLYDDKSDTEVSSNVDEMTTPVGFVNNSEREMSHTKDSRLKSDVYLMHGKDMNILKENNPNYSSNGFTQLEKLDNIKQLSNENLKANERGSHINHPVQVQEALNQDPTTIESNIKEHHEEITSDKVIDSDNLFEEKISEIHSGNKKVELPNICQDIERFNAMKLGDGNKNSESETSNFPLSSLDNVDLDCQNKLIPSDRDDRENSQLHTKEGSYQLLANKNPLQEENVQSDKVGNLDICNEIQAGFNEEDQLENDHVPQDQRRVYESNIPQQYQDENTYLNSDITEYPPNYNTEPNDPPKHQKNQEPECYASEEYLQKDGHILDHTKDSNGKETIEPDISQQPEVYTDNNYEQQHLEYEGRGFRGSQQNIANYSQPLLTQQYKDKRYINPVPSQDHPYEQQYKNGEHYLPEDKPENYVVENDGEFSLEYPQQQYGPGYPDPSQVPDNLPDKYKTAYQDESQYGYDKVGAPFDEQYKENEPEYDQKPPYDHYEQQPAEVAYDQQYQQQPVEEPYDQYKKQPAEPPYEQYEQKPAEPPYEQYEQQPGRLTYDQHEQQADEVPYDQYEQQAADVPYDQYQQQTGDVPYEQYQQKAAKIPYDQYAQQPADTLYDQYEQQPAEIPYDQYEQQPPEVPYDQYEQPPAEAPYDQYEQQQPAEIPYDQYEQPPAEAPYDQYEQQPAEAPYDQYEQQPAEIPYDQYEQQPAEATYDQYEQQPAEAPYDQYEQQTAEIPYDQYQQEPTNVSYSNYEKQPSDPSYNQLKQQPSEHYDDQYQGPAAQYENYDYPYDQPAPINEQPYVEDPRQNYVEETQPYDYNEPLQHPYDGSVQQELYNENLPYEGPDDSQRLPQQDMSYEVADTPLTQTDFRETNKPASNINQILESDSESSAVQKPARQEDSSDFDFSASQK